MSKNQLVIQAFVDKCDFEDYEGYTVLFSPTLYTKDKKGKVRQWQIVVGAGKEDVTMEKITDRIAVHMGYYFTISGLEDGKKTTSARTELTCGKSAGRENKTTALTQAAYEAQSKYQKYIDDGYVLSKSDIVDETDISFAQIAKLHARGEFPWRVFPAASDKYENYGERVLHTAIAQPSPTMRIVEVQPKLDGTMAIAVRLPDGTIDMYSRGKETDYSQPHVREALADILDESHTGLYIVGELWRTGYSLQEISGAARKKSGEAVPLYFNVFDCFQLGAAAGMKRLHRIVLLEKLFNPRKLKPDAIYAEMEVKTSHADVRNTPVRMVPSYFIKIPDLAALKTAQDEIARHFDTFLEDELEGAMIRDLHAPYEFGLNKEKRSKFILKWKPLQDAEWPVVGYTEGNGGDKGAIIWICGPNEDFISNGTVKPKKAATRPTFNVVMNMENETRKKIYAAMDKTTFEMYFEGQLLTIKYGGELSQDTGFPQQPRALQFRDPKVQTILLGLVK